MTQFFSLDIPFGRLKVCVFDRAVLFLHDLLSVVSDTVHNIPVFSMTSIRVTGKKCYHVFPFSDLDLIGIIRLYDLDQIDPISKLLPWIFMITDLRLLISRFSSKIRDPFVPTMCAMTQCCFCTKRQGMFLMIAAPFLIFSKVAQGIMEVFTSIF